jgi:phosphoribosyl 1,2-cyclic phosphodiesterase
MQVYTLFSGSSGNCIYVKDERTEILIDAGKSAQAIEKALSGIGTSIKSIDAILVTHEHSDHFVGLEILSKKHHIPVHITEKSYKKAVYQGSYVSQCAKAHDTHYELEIGSLKIKSFEIPHDSAQNVGYIIKGSDETLGIATDIGYVTDEIVEALSKCDRVILESNHDKYMLICGKYPEFLKQRILSNGGHLSNEDSSRLACVLAKNGVKSITLAHLSKENNTPTLAHDTMREVLDLNGYVNVKLAVASPADPFKLH